MADKNTSSKSKKTTAKASVKKDVKDIKNKAIKLAADYRAMTIEELNLSLQEARADLLKAQKMLKANELPASHVIRQMRTKIARIHTVMTEKNNERKSK